METNHCINILLVGESGVGKSTLINSFANYIQHESLQAASKTGFECLIPTVFTLSDNQYNEHIIQFGCNDEKVGKTTTQECSDYVFNVQDIPYPIRFIDTPGVGNSNDEEAIRKITQHIKSYTHLNAICFLLQPNVNTLGEFFKYTIEHLLNTIRGAAPNIIFVFTNSRSTFYKPGETLTILQEFVDGYKIPLSKENMFCVDNEGFRCGVALQQGFPYTLHQFVEFERSWKVSESTLRDMLIYIVEELRPIESEKIVAGKYQNCDTPSSLQSLQGAISKIQINQASAQASTSNEMQARRLIGEIREQARNSKEEVYNVKRSVRNFKDEFDMVNKPVSAGNQELCVRAGGLPQEDEVEKLRLQNRELLKQRDDFVNQISTLQQPASRDINTPKTQVFINHVGSIIEKQENITIHNNRGNYSGNFNNNTLDLSFPWKRK